MNKLFGFLLLLIQVQAFGQLPTIVTFNKGYDNIPINAGDSLQLQLNVQKGSTYQVLVRQMGIDVILTLTDAKGNKILEQDSPNGSRGFEIVDYKAPETQSCTLTIKKFEEEGTSNQGFVSYYIKKYTDKEVAIKEQTIKELAIENQKKVLTLDIDHFWEAFDHLKNCTSTWDSIITFQNLYFDRGTDGLKDFVRARQWSPELFVAAVGRLNKYYTTVRPYTYKVDDAEPVIEEVFGKFKTIYGNFKPFSVCFAIGFHNTGGTVSNRFVLLGTEMVTSGINVDYSELNSQWKRDPSKEEIDIPQAIRGIVAHECVHTQQPEELDSNAVGCNQLYFCLREGAANFIGELISGNTNYNEVNQYGDAHEASLWSEFKSTLCAENATNWLYNGNHSKDRPADLGYYIGYKICQAYYHNTLDKQQAIKDIIEIKDPLLFLQKSGYDKQKKG